MSKKDKGVFQIFVTTAQISTFKSSKLLRRNKFIFLKFQAEAPSFAEKATAGKRYNFEDFDIFDKYYFLNVPKCASGIFYMVYRNV